MLGENIRAFRKKQGISQEDLALKMHVVRQTISKWENGLSVPDAEELIRLSEILGASVDELLGMEAQNDSDKEDIANELVRLNEELAERKERERLLIEAGKVRGAILALAFATVILAFVIGNSVGAIITTAVCCIAALIILYNNLGLLTSVTTGDLRLKPLRITTIFNISLIAACAVIAVLIKVDIVSLSQNGEKFMAALVVSIIIFFTGYIAPKLPFNRHTGMRLPWTVTDEECWNVAHQILGITAVPVGIVYLGLVPFISNFEALTVAVMLLWIGIPAGSSLVYFWRKFRRI